MELQNTHQKKILTQELPTRINFGPMNTHDKILELQRNHEKKFQTQKIPMRKKVGPTKAWWHLTHRTHDSTQLTKSSKLCFFKLLKSHLLLRQIYILKTANYMKMFLSQYLITYFAKVAKNTGLEMEALKKNFFDHDCKRLGL